MHDFVRSAVFAGFSFLLLFLFNACREKHLVTVLKDGDYLEIWNEKIKARFIRRNDKTISQEYYAQKNGGWIKIVESFHRPKDFPKNATQLLNTSLDSTHRFLVANALKEISVESESDHEIVVRLHGTVGNATIVQEVRLEPQSTYFHFKVHAELAGHPAKLDYLLSAFTFNLHKPPEFVHTPGLKFDNEDSKQNRFKLLPGRDQIIGDRAFHAPAIILQEGDLFAALVPDLNAINEYAVVSPDARRTLDIQRNKFSVPVEDDKYTMPTGLDLNVQTGLTAKPVFTYGLMDNIIAHHIRYQRVNDSTMIRTLLNNSVQYEFDLFVAADVQRNTGFQRISAHQWKMFGHPVFIDRPHLAMPFEEYFRIVDSITFKPNPHPEIDAPLKGYADMGSWLQFELDGLPVGGYRSSIPWWNDVLHNSAFWNNARDAQGFWYWGNRLNRPELIEKGRRIINWCLLAPRNNDGLFALLYRANDKEWSLGFTDPVNEKYEFFLKESNSYDVSSMSKTAAHMLDYHLRCEKDQRIIDYLIPYGNWLLTVIDERGAVPSYIDANNMVASPILHYSAQPSSSMWFLAELYNATRKISYLDGAKRIAEYLENEILPEQKWIDMEQYFSCGKKPLNFQRDRWQNQPARGNLALFWAIEGFAALYRATSEDKFLESGEQCIDYVTFTQACWEPHYIYTAFPFGGFSVDNADNATFLDARQAEMVRSFIWFGKTLGRQDLLERGVAAARSSVVLMNHPRHKSNNIYRHTNIYPIGLGPENIDHEGHPQSAMRTHPSWGEGSGVFTGLAEAGRELGGIFIDFDKGLQVGVDGVTVIAAVVEEHQINLSIEPVLARLRQPWEQAYEVELRINGIKEREYELTINNVELGKFSKADLEKLKLKVTSNARIEI